MSRNFMFAVVIAAAAAGCRPHHHGQASAEPAISRPRSSNPPLSSPPALPADHVVLEWNDEALAAVKAGETRPTVVARDLYLIFSATYDAWALHQAHADPTALSGSLRRPEGDRSAAAEREAVCFAAWRALVLIFPTREATFTARLQAQGYDPGASTDPGTPSGLGRAAAESVIAARASDESNSSGNYADTTGYVAVNSDNPSAPNYPGKPGFDPNHWQPLRVPTGTVHDSDGNPIVDDADPASYKVQKYLTPQWSGVTPFAMASGDEFRPLAPPQFGSSAPYTDVGGLASTSEQAWVREFDQVLSVNANLTDRQKVIAEFWAGGPGTETPPGLWNRMSRDVLVRDSAGVDDDVRLLFALNGALLDSSIACWDSKHAFDFIRPISAIRHRHHGELVLAWGGPGKGTMTIPADEWRPYQPLTFVTPPFPEAVSGHSTFGGAWARVMRLFKGSGTFFDGSSTLAVDRDGDGSPDLLGRFAANPGFLAIEPGPASQVVLQWNTFSDASDEACNSRLYGGIHINESNMRGRDMGLLIGEKAFLRAKAYWEGTAVP